jgi:hypothetical protein
VEFGLRYLALRTCEMGLTKSFLIHWSNGHRAFFLCVMVDHGGIPQAASGPGEREARLPQAHRGRETDPSARPFMITRAARRSVTRN